MASKYKATVQELLDGARITINGSNPYDIQVHDERLYRRIIIKGSLGLGESYMDGWWDVERLDEFFYRVLKYRVDEKVKTWLKHFSEISSASPSRCLRCVEELRDGMGLEGKSVMRGPP